MGLIDAVKRLSNFLLQFKKWQQTLQAYEAASSCTQPKICYSNSLSTHKACSKNLIKIFYVKIAVIQTNSFLKKKVFKNFDPGYKKRVDLVCWLACALLGNIAPAMPIIWERCRSRACKLLAQAFRLGGFKLTIL